MREYTLRNGKTVKQPFNKIWIVLAVLVVLFVIFMQFIPITGIRYNFPVMWKMLYELFVPYNGRTWSDYFAYFQEMGKPLVETLQISFGGTLIGGILAFPVAFLSARNIIKNRLISIPIKLFMNLIRSIPAVVLAVIGLFLVGLGVLAGLIGIALFSFGIMSKMLYEAIETVDMSPFEALESGGANKVISFRYAVLSQILPIYLGYMIYVFEINIRASAILGYIGAGGIGQIINDNAYINNNRVGVAIIVIFLTTLVVQLLSNIVRRKLK